MHKNLVTRISFEPAHNRLDALENFQELISDYAYGTHFTIYGKFQGVYKTDDHNFFKMENAVLYLQNYSGQATVGMFDWNLIYETFKIPEKERPTENLEFIEIDMGFDEGVQEPVYFVNLYVTPLYHNPFYPKQTKNNIDEFTETLKDKNIPLDVVPVRLKKELSIKNFEPTSEEQKIIDDMKVAVSISKVNEGYLNLNYKFMFHIIHFPYFHEDMMDKAKNAKSIFLDDINYERNGEIIKRINPATGIEKLMTDFILHPSSNIDPVTGRINPGHDKQCHNGIAKAD